MNITVNQTEDASSLLIILKLNSISILVNLALNTFFIIIQVAVCNQSFVFYKFKIKTLTTCYLFNFVLSTMPLTMLSNWLVYYWLKVLKIAQNNSNCQNICAVVISLFIIILQSLKTFDV
jgi:hypothetical protein